MEFREGRRVTHGGLMKKSLYATAVAAFLLASVTSRADPAEYGWKDQKGDPVPDTESQRTLGGFGAWMIVTSDEDWETKWATPSTDVPRFTTADTVSRGGKLFILTLFSNPKVDGTSKADVTMSIDVYRPDGSSSTHQQNATCFKGPIRGSPQNLYLCGPVLGFVGDPTDPLGHWSVKISLTDNLRNVTVPVSSGFLLKE